MMLDIIGIGNAIVDMLAQTDEAFLLQENLHKGSMVLIDEPRAHDLFSRMGPVTTVSGGSAANAIVGCASFGLKTGFIGRVKQDDVGEIFAHDIRAAGVQYTTRLATRGPATGRCLILVTPDGERTMNTFLGANLDLHPDDVDESFIQSAHVLYLEGYMWDPPAAKQAMLKAAQIAHKAGKTVALSLSDMFCV